MRLELVIDTQNAFGKFLTRCLKLRARLLDFLKADELNTRFGGPVFVFVLIAVSIFLASSWYQNNWGGLFDFHSELSHVVEREDYLAFYRAGELAIQGQAVEAYNPAIFNALFAEKNKDLLFLNPPHSILFFEPMAYFAYPIAKLVGMAVFFASFVGMTLLIRPSVGAWPYLFLLASPGAFYAFQLLQLSPLTTFLLLFAMLNSRVRPLLSGLALSVLTIKPQYGLLIPLFLAANQDWRSLVYAALSTVGLLVLSVGVHGWALWWAFLESIQSGAHSIQFSANHGMMSTVASSFGKWGASHEFKLFGQFAAFVVAGTVIWFSARRFSRTRSVAISLLAISLASPSFMYYDWLLFSAALLIVMKEVPTWPVSLQISAGLLWIAPTIYDVLYAKNILASLIFSSLVPLIAVMVLFQVLVLFLKNRPFQSGSKPGQELVLQTSG